MLTTLISLTVLSTNITYPSEGYEVGSGQEKEYLITPEPTTYPLYDNDNETYIIIPKKSKKSKKGKKGKHFNDAFESSELFGFQSDSETNTNIILASVGGIMVVTGMVMVVKNYCNKRRGYNLMDNADHRPLYGTIGNEYQGH
jgi:hypothetical protein